MSQLLEHLVHLWQCAMRMLAMAEVWGMQHLHTAAVRLQLQQGTAWEGMYLPVQLEDVAWIVAENEYYVQVLVARMAGLAD